MVYLFNHPIAVSVTLGYEEDPEIDMAIVSPELWTRLIAAASHSKSSLAITISRAHSEKAPKSLTCWCSPGPTFKTAGVMIPHSWIMRHSTLFFDDDMGPNCHEPTHQVTIFYPIPLDEVFLLPLSTPAYETLLSLSDPFQNWYSKRAFLCQGDIVAPSWPSAVRSDNDSRQPSDLECLVKMTGPSQQGFVQVGTTKIYIIPNSGDCVPRYCNSAEAYDFAIRTGSEPDSYDIDEEFLGSAIMTGSPSAHSQGRTYGLSQRRLQLSTASDTHTVYVRTSDLGRIGVLAGDWAIARSVEDSTYRIVHVCSDDTVVPMEGTISVSSMLHYNMVKDPSKLRSTRIEVLPTPFGSSRPAIPTARTVTIARIASPLSVDRAYQPLFLRKLHDYFNHHKRLVKQGDLIAVSLDTDVIGYSCHSEEDVAEGFAGIGVKDAVTSRHGLDFGCSNEIIFFMITNVECGGLPLDGHGGFYAGITAGEWGCWVDSAVTRIIQVGVEHSRVPDLTGYFGIDSTSSVDLNKPSQKLLTLTSAALTHGASEYHLQLSVILQGTRGVGKMTAAINVARQLGLHVLEINCYDMIGESDVQTEGFLRARFEKATTCSPCFFILRHIDSLAQTSQSSDSTKAPAVADILSECIESLQEAWALSGFPVIVIGITDHPDQASPQILACFKHTIVFEVPEEGERHVILESLVHDVPLAPDVSLKEIAVQTAALVASDIVDLVVRGQHASVQRVTQNSARDNSAGICTVGSLLASGDLEKALNKARASYSESIGAPKIPNVSWDDVGGLTSVKTDILDTIQLPLEHPELFSGGLKKRSGILLYGPPGTGKTLLAKAVATSCTLNFFSVKGPELLNMYIGESEANVRRVFQRARDAKPCVIFFDELDSVAPKRGNHGDSGGVMDRIVSQLLAELDGVAAGDAGADVFVIGATNRPDLLDSALLRPGRFDRMLYLGVSQTHEAQLNILQALTRKFKLDPELDLQRVAESCPFHYTGADFYALCSDALLKAMSRKAEELELKIAALNAEPADLRHPYPLTPQYFLAEMASSADIDVLVSQDDFDSALRELVPSVSQDEMEHYARVQRQFSRETINKS